ncbi:SHSP domain-containing protein, partial [Favolaschia claudopus]
RMSPVRTTKTSRMTEPNSEQRQRARKLIQDVIRGLREGNIRMAQRNLNKPYRPRMEIYDNPESPNIVATFELPGVKIEDISTSVMHDRLVIQGARYSRHKPNQHPSIRSHPSPAASDMDVEADTHAKLFPCDELRYGKFYRAIPLPPGVTVSSISARLLEGLLTVTWPRSATG